MDVLHCDQWLAASRERLELLRMVGPGIPKIPDQAEYVWDRYEISVNFLPLSSDEGEGMYLYDTRTEEVHDYGLARHDQFLSGEASARWKNFLDFIVWYINDDDRDA